MITQKRIFLYQPGPLQSLINWSWIFILLFMGIIFWLEVTVIQWITVLFFLAFVVFAILQIMFHKITIVGNQLIIGRILNPRWMQIDIHQIKAVHVTKHRANIEVNNRVYKLLLPVNSVIELNNLINK
jgi:hypothetical protein